MSSTAGTLPPANVSRGPLQMKEWGCYDKTIWVDMSGAEAPQRIADAARETGIQWDGVYATHDHQQALTGQVRLRICLDSCLGNDRGNALL